ncbi:uncharacterized protein YALI1_F24408g [Yarrowia lipolytica]|jgi:ubiquitin-like protein Nedd8|uniref:Ubiquitin-like domain-containing protein n=1 Tax=Yarrowia lipolytica TaxID=4952 RepID=A0A1D8NP23_YARLL|nr:hypothetical protein YALI1_F24408g [Yarrowia lipolytica]
MRHDKGKKSWESAVLYHDPTNARFTYGPVRTYPVTTQTGLTQISVLKEKIEELEGIPPAQQRLVFTGKQLQDEKTIAENKIEAGASLHLVLALRGGN